MENTYVLLENGSSSPKPRFYLKTENGQHFEVPAEGSLGLLALGYTGLMAWREMRHQADRQTIDTYSSTLTQSKHES